MTSYVRIISGPDAGSVYHISGVLSKRAHGVTSVALKSDGRIVRVAPMKTMIEIARAEFELLGGKYPGVKP